MGGLLTARDLRGQAVRFSQYEAAPLLLNPALPGTLAHPTLALNYRLQQLGVLTYRTGYFSALLPVYAPAAPHEALPVGGLGLGVLSDRAGEQNELQTYQVDVSAAYNLRLNRAQTHYVTLGLQASYRQTTIDYGPLTWPSQITYRGFEGPAPPVGVYGSGATAFRFNTGAVWTYDPGRNPWKKLVHYRLHLGTSVANLNRPDYSFREAARRRLPYVYRVHGGGEFRASPRLTVSPGFFVIAQESLVQYAGGATLGIRLQPDPSGPAGPDFRLLLGGWYRYGEAAVLLVGARHRRVEAALSYDLNASAERAGIRNQHALELSLAYRFLTERSPKVHPTPLF